MDRPSAFRFSFLLSIPAILGAAGHHGTVLIADGNYPVSSKRGPRAEGLKAREGHRRFPPML